MENFDTEFITPLLNEEKTTEEVSLILQYVYPNKRKLPLRSLKRYCAKLVISKRTFRNTLDNLVAEALETVRFRGRHNKVYQVKQAQQGVLGVTFSSLLFLDLSLLSELQQNFFFLFCGQKLVITSANDIKKKRVTIPLLV